MQTHQIWGAHAAGVLHSAAAECFRGNELKLGGARFHVNLRFAYE